MTEIIELDDHNFAEEVYTTKKPILIMFSSDWCDNCKEFQNTTLQKLLTEYDDKVKFAKVNIHNAYELTSRFQISKLPSFILYKESLPVNFIIGNLSLYKFKEAIDEVI